jgi:hypothetical protein
MSEVIDNPDGTVELQAHCGSKQRVGREREERRGLSGPGVLHLVVEIMMLAIICKIRVTESIPPPT